MFYYYKPYCTKEVRLQKLKIYSFGELTVLLLGSQGLFAFCQIYLSHALIKSGPYFDTGPLNQY